MSPGSFGVHARPRRNHRSKQLFGLASSSLAIAPKPHSLRLCCSSAVYLSLPIGAMTGIVAFEQCLKVTLYTWQYLDKTVSRPLTIFLTLSMPPSLPGDMTAVISRSSKAGQFRLLILPEAPSAADDVISDAGGAQAVDKLSLNNQIVGNAEYLYRRRGPAIGRRPTSFMKAMSSAASFNIIVIHKAAPYLMTTGCSGV